MSTHTTDEDAPLTPAEFRALLFDNMRPTLRLAVVLVHTRGITPEAVGAALGFTDEEIAGIAEMVEEMERRRPTLTNLIPALPQAVRSLVALVPAGADRAAAFGQVRHRLGHDFGDDGLRAWDAAVHHVAAGR